MDDTIIPHVVKDQEIHALRAANTAFEAAQHMEKYNLAAIVVVNDRGTLVGIATERDITRRIVAADRDPKQTSVAEFMTPNPDTLRPSDTAKEALRRMQAGRYRHLPVVDHGNVVGMVSMRDLYETIYRAVVKN